MVSLVRWPLWLCLLLLLAGCGDGGGSSGSITPTPPPAANRAPVITSAGSVSVPENSSTDIFQVVASDPDGDPLTYSLSGTDAALFTISTAGKVRFVNPPDYEKPADANHDNVYEIQVTVSDGKLQAQAPLTVTVTNVVDQTVVTRVGGTYLSPAQVTAVPGQKLVFVARQSGQIYLVDPATQDQGSLYLTVPNNGSSDPGIVSLVAAPDFATSGFVYVMFVNNRVLQVVRYGRLTAAQADAASARTVLSIPLATSFYDGGWIGFGPNNLLYVATGEGNIGGNGANLSSLLGKVLRIDPSRDDFPADAQRNYGIPADNPFVAGGALPEIYVYGINRPSGGSFSGNNLYLGDAPRTPFADAEVNLMRPQDSGRDYDQSHGGIAPVINVAPFNISGVADAVGGFVYTGPSPQLVGQYVFYAGGRTGQGIFGLPAAQLTQSAMIDSGQAAKLADLTARSVGQDADGNLYVLDTSGALYVFRAG
jgi:glucose/arabinose dehydrogenase